MKKSLGYRILIWILFFTSLVLLWRVSDVLIQPKYIPVDDFVRHWAAGKLFLHRADPYSIANVQVLQDQATGPEAHSEVINTIYIPPWSMLILTPFAVFDYPISRLAWLLFSVILSIISAELLWKTYEGPPQKKWLSWVLVFTFSPTISVLEKGQTGCLVLLGVAGFLYYEKFQKYWLAGIFAALITIKPQLVFLFWLALIFWSLKQRNFIILLSFGTTLFLTSLITLFINPQIFQQYLSNIRFHSPLMWATPTIGGHLRYFIFGVEQFWPQYIGPLFGMGYFLVYWVKENRQWLWLKQTPDLILASAITSFYSWTYDQVVIVAAIIKAWICLIEIKKNVTRLLMIIFFLIQLINLILHRYLDDFWFLWLAPVTLIWYLAVIWSSSHSSHDSSLAGEPL